MYTQSQTKLHERSVNVLELIKEANTRIEDVRHHLYMYDHSNSPFSMIRLFNTREEILTKKKKYEAIRDRLVCWYADIMQRLFEEAMFRVGKSKNVVQIAEEVF